MTSSRSTARRGRRAAVRAAIAVCTAASLAAFAVPAQAAAPSPAGSGPQSALADLGIADILVGPAGQVYHQ